MIQRLDQRADLVIVLRKSNTGSKAGRFYKKDGSSRLKIWKIKASAFGRNVESGVKEKRQTDCLGWYKQKSSRG